jgi:hypothetical protein
MPIEYNIKKTKKSSFSTEDKHIIVMIYDMTYPRFIPEEVAEAFQIFFRYAHVLPKLLYMI